MTFSMEKGINQCLDGWVCAKLLAVVMGSQQMFTAGDIPDQLLVWFYQSSAWQSGSGGVGEVSQVEDTLRSFPQ